MTDKLIEQLRDEDSYYRVQEKHWCIDAEELERQRLAAADRIEALTAENEKLRARIAKDIEVELSMCAIANGEANSEWIDGFDFAWKRVRAALGDTQ